MGRFTKIALSGIAFAGAALFGLGAWAVEGALHPPRLPVARVCPCFAHVSCEPVDVTARDGVALRAWYYRPETPDGKAVILLHGLGSTRQDMLALGALFLHRGYSVLEPDLRGHGESGGFTTYGVLERGDIRAWLDWLQNSANIGRIYGFGASLGGSVLLESLTRESRFRAVVAESAYSDFPSIAGERVARILPTGLKWITWPIVESGIAWSRFHEGVNLRAASALDAMKSTHVPVLLIHGLADRRTSPDNSRRLAELDPDAVLWLVPGSGHTDAWKTAPREFESRVTEWFNSH